MLQLEEISFDPASVVDNVVKAFVHSAEQKDLKIRASLARDVPDGVIGDPGRLRQILINLVGNAVKFTPKGEISIEVHVAEDLDKSMKLRFAVKDTGHRHTTRQKEDHLRELHTGGQFNHPEVRGDRARDHNLETFGGTDGW